MSVTDNTRIAEATSTIPSPPETGGRKRMALKAAATALALLVLLLLPRFVKSPLHLNLLILMLMAAQMGAAWNILGGYAGQISLGHAAFFGIGAYTSTLLFLHYGVNPWIGMLLGAVMAAVLSLPIGLSCFRLKGHYFAMATIAVAEIVQVIFNNWDYAGSAEGLYLPMAKQGWRTMIFASKAPYYYLALGLLGLTLLANLLVSKSFLGYYFRAIKDEPDAARSLGVGLTRYKQIALLVSSALTALGGTLYAQKELYIDPGSVLTTALSIKIALVVILGGVGTLFGPPLGAVVLTSIEESTRITFGGTGRGTDQIIYALLIIAVAVFYPSGIAGWFRNLAQRRKARRSYLGGDE
jgi:branched-chain amino acid transport system permease protein